MFHFSWRDGKMVICKSILKLLRMRTSYNDDREVTSCFLHFATWLVSGQGHYTRRFVILAHNEWRFSNTHDFKQSEWKSIRVWKWMRSAKCEIFWAGGNNFHTEGQFVYWISCYELTLSLIRPYYTFKTTWNISLHFLGNDRWIKIPLCKQFTI